MSGDENIEEAFLLYDKRGDNKIECSQVGEVLRALGINPTEYEIKKLINGIDPTGEGRVSFSEFLPMYQSLRDRHKKDRRGRSLDNNDLKMYIARNEINDCHEFQNFLLVLSSLL